MALGASVLAPGPTALAMDLPRDGEPAEIRALMKRPWSDGRRPGVADIGIPATPQCMRELGQCESRRTGAALLCFESIPNSFEKKAPHIQENVHIAFQ